MRSFKSIDSTKICLNYILRNYIFLEILFTWLKSNAMKIHRARTLYKSLGYFIILEILLQHKNFVSPLKIRPPYNPKDEVELVNPKEIPYESFSPEYSPSIEEIRVETNIRFRYATTKVISKIVNEDSKSHSINFTLTIPSEAFITNLQMMVDGKYYNSNNVTSKEKAKEMYEYARKEGRSVTAGVLEQGKIANAFALNFIIGSKKTVRFRVTYEELLIRNDDRYEYTFNFKSTQVYISVLNYRIKVSIDESQPIKVHVPDMHKEFSSGVLERQPKIRTISPTKAVVNWNWNNSYLEDLSVIEKQFEDQFVLQYVLENETAGGEILIRNGHFVHFFAPVGMKPLTKHVVFVLDVSDSMVGEKRRQLESAMLEILDILNKEDFFNIITFSGDTQLWSYFYGNQSKMLYPFPAIADYKQSAEYFIKTKLEPHGSTNIFAALEKALEVCHNVSSKMAGSHTRNTFQYLRQQRARLNETLPDNVESIIVFLTDGEPTSGIVDHMHLLQTVREMNINPFVPIYSLAFGDAADYEFLKELSAQNGGFSRKIFEDASAGSQVANFYEEISMPVMSNVTFKYTSKNPRFNFQLNISQENHLIFKGQEVVYFGQLPDSGNSSWNNSNFNATIEGKTQSGHVSYSSIVKSVCVPASGIGYCSTDEETNDDVFLQRLFVYLDIRNFVMKDMDAYDNDYSNLTMSYCEGILNNEENLEDSAKYDRKPCEYKRRKQKIIDAAIKFKFVTPFTSLSLRTKSIGQEENENVGQSQNLENWEWFLGSEIPAPKGMKISAVDVDTDESQQEIIAIPSMPRAAALTNSKQFNQMSNSTTETTITNFHINRTSKKVVSRDQDALLKKIPDRMQLALSLSKIHLLPLSNNTNSNYTTRRNVKLTLADLKWLGTSEVINIPAVNENNKTVPTYYRILRDSEFNNTLESSFKLCETKSSGALVECRHLKDCVLREFIDDFELFKSSYICPKEVVGERFLGSCCPIITA